MHYPFKKSLFSAFLCCCLVFPIHAQDQKKTYQTWFKDFKKTALNHGITDKTIHMAMPFTDPIKRVMQKDRKQIAYISNYWHYQKGNMTQKAITHGQKMMAKQASLFDAVSKKYGIPKTVLGALWAMETNYGGFTGKTNVIHALATLAYEGRREDYFTRSLLSALYSIQTNNINPKTFLGSYDGGYGHFQFMPMTAYGDRVNKTQGYAIDGDNDGKIDILNSFADALYSAGHYLSQMGWQPNQPWGHQVIIPKSFDIMQTGYKDPKPLSHWQQQGVTRIKGESLIKAPLTSQSLATMIMPAGVTGPVFLLYDNHRVLKKWNQSNTYGMAFATIATQLSGKSIRLPKNNTAGEKRLTQNQIKFMQQVLKKQYIYKYTVDGWIGTRTQHASQQYQHKHGLIPDGYMGQSLYTHMKTLYGKRPLNKDKTLDNHAIKFMQSVLKTKGMYGNAIDGIVGKGTKKAIMTYQKKYNLVINDTALTNVYNHMQDDYAVPLPK